MSDKNNYELLKQRDIYDILDGDTHFEDYEFEDSSIHITVSMPYLKGADICKISTQFGLPTEYKWGGVNLSRWQYMENLLDYCIKNNRCSDLLKYLFGKQQFTELFRGHSPNVIDAAYKFFTNTILCKINGVLYFGGHELVILGGEFVVRRCGEKIEVQTPQIKTIDREYIKSISDRAMQDIDRGNYDSAITKSRTLLEEVFCYVIEKKGELPSTSGRISDLYKQVKDLYSMHGDASTDKRINTLLSGLEKIVESISEMRNKDSDAHGVGLSRIAIEEHHARLFVNAAMTMADFILSVEIKSDNNLKQTT